MIDQLLVSAMTGGTGVFYALPGSFRVVDAPLPDSRPRLTRRKATDLWGLQVFRRVFRSPSGDCQVIRKVTFIPAPVLSRPLRIMNSRAA